MQFSLFDSIKSHVDNFSERLNTATPAIVEAYHPETATIDCIPAIYKKDKDGVLVKSGVLEGVPVHFSATEEVGITYPLKKGDQVMLIFTHNDSENWLDQEEDFVEPKTLRRHSVSDAFAIPWRSKYGSSPVKEPDNLNIYYGKSKVSVKPDGTIDITEGNSASGVTLSPNGDVDIFSVGDLNISSLGTTTIAGGKVVIQK